MKKLYGLLFIMGLSTALFAQTKESNKHKSDTTKNCKPTKSGKHCGKPNK